MDNFVFSVRNTIEKFNMLNNNDNVVVGVSGGADSTALLYSLISLREIYNINIVCAHLNHGIRGDEAARDERYVRELSQKLNINFFCKHVDIPLIAKQKKQSEELTGREERYKFFNEILNKLGGGKIAVAHNKNDFVETVLIKLTRGASLNGLKGISPVNAAIIRPLIEIERNKIELYLDKNNIKYMTDSTNDKDIYTRNLIRNNVIKELCKINPSFVNTVYKNSLSIADDDDYIESNAKKYYKKCVQTVNNSVLIDLNLIEDLHISLKKRIILYAVSVLKGNKINIENKHLEILANLHKTGKRYDIMSDLKAYIDYKKLVLCSKIPEYADYEYEIETDKSYTVNGQCIKFKLTDNTDMSDKTCMYVSADNAKKLVLRNRRNGDKFAPSGMSGEKKLNRYFIDNKISQDLRQKIPLLCINDEIAVVIGYRVSENFIVTNETKSIIKISICGGTNE